MRALLADRGIGCGTAERFWGPRRLAVRFADVAEVIPAREVEVQGPPARVAFDAEGKPTMIGVGFSRAHGRTPGDLYRRKTERGEYALLKKTQPAVDTADVLRSGLPAVIGQIQFPKAMRWLEDDTRFARPIRWLVCLLGDDVVEFEFAGLVAGRETLGHRGVPGKVRLAGPGEYEQALENACVISGFDRRREALLARVTGAANRAGGRPVPDDDLVEETVNITEWPTPVLCRFDKEFLALPAPVLVTALKKHQRCFAVEDSSGRLLPHFIAVADAPGCDETAFGRWVERAVESRLRDARFFFDADMKTGLAALVEEEKRVSWFEGMGSLFDKTGRLRALARVLVAMVPSADAAVLDRAAELAKADLLTAMVREKEFTSLQGRMGGVYARSQGEPEPVARAIEEQYLPASAGDRLPETVEGALLGIADRVDNVVAAFIAGAIPTGSEDPFALRRQAAGLIAIVLEQELAVDLSRLVETAVGLFNRPGRLNADRLPGFFQERLEAALGERGIRYDVAEAVLETCWHLPNRARAAAEALAGFRSNPDFEKLIVGQKRVANILRGQEVAGEPNPAVLFEEAERRLYSQAEALAPEVAGLAERADFGPALELLLTLRPAIDRLFDDVLVMDKDEAVRLNRLRLLLFVQSLFRQVADLSRIVIEGDSQP